MLKSQQKKLPLMENKMTNAQQKHLKERLQFVASCKPTRYTAIEMDEPEAVKKANKQIETAKKVVDAFTEKKEEGRKKRNEAIAKARSECERAIYFGNPTEALKAIDKFEATKF